MRTVILSITILALMAASGAYAAPPMQCCLEGCGNPTWNSCANGSACTGGFCASPLGSAIMVTEDACGTGAASSCPATEAGQCADGVNNDVWTGDTDTDCADRDCAGDSACNSPAPAAGPMALGILALALAIGGAATARRRFHA